ncbi:hypothetical protein AGOR_G00040780 [Albula goreensis]|uniref:Ig-like domain-containing protein n=1 Tax=Albula goreensis TaxID=1534307 RepID=A0A8T3E5Z8_9TELE|nr:hypothetical protein AGOR_G00040780 [Albula goreensis]
MRILPWGYGKVFGSGTKLIVTETPKQAKAPEVIAYPPSSPVDGKTAFLCIAKEMFPDVVKFRWETNNGEDVTKYALTQTSTNEKSEITHITSILIRTEQTNKFKCTVAHEADSEGKPQRISTPSVENKPREPKATCPPKTDGSAAEETDVAESIDGTFELTRSLYLANLTYTLMILKSVAYFGVASLLAYKRSKPSMPVARR